MRKNLLLLVAFCTINLSFGQYYISSSIGQAIGSAEVKFGEIMNTSESKNSYGSYGEGTNFQIRTGYFFNDTFGVDLGFGYLHGSDQTVRKVNLPSRELIAIARGRAFGFTPSVVYKFTNKVYGRFGALIKLGGKTEAVVYDKNYIADEASGTTISQAFALPAGAFTETNYIEDFHGKLPLGFVGAFGFKHKLKNNLNLFLEAEYMGVSVKRNDSEIKEFNTDVVLENGTVAVSGLYSIDKFPAGYVKNSIYVDELSNTNTDPSVKLAERVPYSSFGVNFGITYTFSKK